MNDKRPETFDELFEPGNLYDHITEREVYLIDKLLETADVSLPLIRIYSNRSSTDKVFDFLGKWIENNGTENLVTEFSDDPPSVSFKLKNGTTIFSDYICVEYFRLYLVEAEREHLKRYTYFEIYYDDYIVTCLMDIATFRKDGALDRLDMDAKEWAYAKMQMKLWKQAIYPEIEELEQDSALLERITAYYDLEEFKDKWEEETDPKFVNNAGIGDIWAALAYLCSLQILEWLPPKYLPQYAINFVCSSDYYCQQLSDKLRAILSGLFKDDCYVKGHIPLHSEYQQSKSKLSSPCSVRPYIFRVQRTSSVRDLLVDLKHFSHIQTSKKKWAKHPFRYDVPICISDKEIVDSAVLNIIVKDETIQSLSADDYPTPSLIRFFCSLRKEEDGEAKCCKRSKIRKWFDDAEETIINAFPDKKKCIKRHKQMFCLCIIFLLIHDIQFYKHELSDNIKSWFEELLKIWQAQDATLKSAVEQVLDMVAKDVESTLTEFPIDKEQLEGEYDGICKTEELLLYRPERLKEKISELPFSLQINNIISKLDKKGILKTNKNRNDNGSKAGKSDYTYSVKVGGKATRFYAFYLDKLKEVE